MMIRIVFINILLFVGGAYSAFAQNLFFKAFQEGFANRPINEFLVDQKGFLWIGTYGAGLHRFDGHSYESHMFDWRDSSSLGSNFINALEEDSLGNIWIGHDKGICYYDPVYQKVSRTNIKYSQNPGQKQISVLTILGTSNGDLFLGTNGNGLIRLERSLHSEGSVDASAFYQNTVVSDLLEDSQGNIFAATSSGLQIFSSADQLLEQPAFVRQEAILQQSLKSIFHHNGTLWIGTENLGLIQVKDYHTDNYVIKTYPITTKRIMDIKLFGGKSLLIATENDGLFEMNLETSSLSHYLHDPYNENSIETNSIWTLKVEQNKRIWLGYYNKGFGLWAEGLNKFKQLKYLVQEENSLGNSSVNSLVSEGDSVLWIGMDGGGIDRYHISKGQIAHLNEKNGYSGLTNTSVQSLFLDDQQTLWAGTWEGGVYTLPKGSKVFRNYNLTNTGLQSNRILDFDQDTKGNIWIATFGAGLHVFSPETNTLTQLLSSEIIKEGIYYSDIRSVFVDESDAVWVGSTVGLFKVNVSEEDTVIQSFRDQFADRQLHPNFNNVLSLFDDQKGKIWIGTDGAGLFSYAPATDSLVWYNQTHGLTLNTICAITNDMQGNIWVTSKEGIAVVDQSVPRTTLYSKKDGLTTNDFNFNSILTRTTNELYFGSQEGINIVNPYELMEDSPITSVYLDKLRIFNKEVRPGAQDSPLDQAFPATQQITLGPDQTVFTIEYTGISFSQSDKIQFAYYLEGLEKDWNYVGNQRSATYTSLKDGDYNFLLKAANSEGEWSDITSLQIVVLPAWYRSRWALVMYIILFLGGLYLLYTLLQIRLRERQEVLTERERHQQNEELTHRKLQFFTNISHEFRTPLTLILNPLAELIKMQGFSNTAIKSLVTAQRNARRLERLIDELMDFRKLNSGKLNIHVHQIDLLRFTKEIAMYFSQEATQNSVALEVHGDLSAHWCWVDSGLVEKMLFNLLSNAFKVTPTNGVISISLAEVKKHLPLLSEGERSALRISVSDTGPGVAQDQLNKIFDRFYQVEQLNKWYFSGTGIGLEVVKSFIELHMGLAEVESKEGEGTTFHLFFPMGKAHFNENDIVQGEYPGKKEFVSSLPGVAESAVSSVPKGVRKSTILVVDDNNELRNYIQDGLKEHYKIETARNGQEGLELVLKVLPDIIISDVLMPEMDGFEFCEAIKKDLKTSHIPIIMLTAKSTVEDQLVGIDKGADVYMTKPFDLLILQANIKRLLKNRQIIFDKYLKGIGQIEVNQDTTAVDREFMQNVVEYVETHLSNTQLSVENIAEAVTMSRSQLYRKVKALTGLNVNEFIRQIRLERAKKLLTNGDININEVSFKVGFSSASYFSKCYKEHFGVSPGTEKKNRQE